MVNLGIIVFANDGGLGAQTRRLAYMLKPFRIMIIDSTIFSKNNQQHFDWYEGMNSIVAQGFPEDRDVYNFLEGLTHVIVCENPLNFSILAECERRGIKLFIQSNYEFCDHLNRPLVPPYGFLMPSFWKLEEMQAQFKNVQHLPPPIDPMEFKEARDTNFSRSGHRFLHVVGTLAAHDRNGTLDLLESLQYTNQNFELVIKSQHALPPEYMTNDSRVTYVLNNQPVEELYKDFDAFILPRRFGGLSLGCNEALMSGLPVIMTNISPNNRLLPAEWLVDAYKHDSFMTRTLIDLYKTYPMVLAKKIDWLCSQKLDDMKAQAFELGYDNFSPSVLKPRYEQLFT